MLHVKRARGGTHGHNQEEPRAKPRPALPVPAIPAPAAFAAAARSIAVALVILGLLAGCSGSGSGSSEPTAAERLRASVDNNWHQYQQRYGVPGGAGLSIYLETPRGTYHASSGMPDGTGPTTHFRIASNTKSFTSAAIMLLYQQGRLRIDDTIVSVIPGQAAPYVPTSSAYDIPNKNSITIRQLMNHTAGVWDVTNENMPSACPAPYAGKNYPTYVMEDLGLPDHQFSPEELINVDAVCGSSYFAPGAGYKYSNTGYSLLAVIIERVSGISYARFVIDNFVAPNALSATSVPVLATDTTVPSPYAEGYLFYNGILVRVTEDNMSGNIAEGNIISTPADLARWIGRLVRGDAGPDTASVAIMKTATSQSGTNNYGCGIQYMSGLGYGHTGAHQGYLSLMAYDPGADVTVVAYFNFWDTANLLTAQADLLFAAARDARRAVGY